MARLDTHSPQRQLIETIPVEVRRSKRRRTRVGLAFDPGGYVIVEAPMDASVAEIRTIIRENQRWLRYRLDQVSSHAGLTACLSYTSGELLHFLGDPFELVVRTGRADQVQLKLSQRDQLNLFLDCRIRGRLCVTLGPVDEAEQVQRPSAHRVRAALVAWYRAEASRRFAAELELWRYRLPWLNGRTPVWRHRFMRSQWGSCSLSGRISLNTHLIKTPPRLIEYVVLHELCHLQHYDHGRRFYGLMTRYMPDWQERRRELDRYLPVLLQD
jgi:hypothetical protein